MKKSKGLNPYRKYRRKQQQKRRRNFRKLLLIISVVIVVFLLGFLFVKMQYKAKKVSIKNLNTLETISSGIDQISQSKWITKDDKTYYSIDGELAKGWQDIDNHRYYFDRKTGEMATDTMVSQNCFVDKKGRLVDKKDIYSYGKEGLTDLREQLVETIGGYNGKTSIYVKNLDTNEYLSITDEQIKSASLIKLYNMATVYDELQKGNLEKNSEVTKYLSNMITASDNAAYNHLLRMIGKGNVSAGCQTITAYCGENGYDNTGCGSTLSSDETGFSPVWLFTNYTTAKDCGHLMEEIYRGNLISEEASEEMLGLLKQQQWRMKIPSGLPSGVVCANKTGEYNNRQHDSAIIYSDGADYILVVLTENDGGAIPHIQNISSMVYKYFNP